MTAQQDDSKLPVASENDADATKASGGEVTPSPEKKPIYLRPEIIAACIGAFGAASVPVVEHFLNNDTAALKTNTAEPATIENNTASDTQSRQQQNSSQSPLESDLKPVSIDKHDSQLTAAPLTWPESDPGSGALSINGVLVTPREEIRIVEESEANVYAEPSVLRAPSILRLELGQQVAIIGKVVDAPWYVVKAGDEYGFVRTKHFSAKAVGEHQ